jgi:hypothetical protein
VLADPHLRLQYITRAISLPRNGLLVQRYNLGARAPYDADHQGGRKAGPVRCIRGRRSVHGREPAALWRRDVLYDDSHVLLRLDPNSVDLSRPNVHRHPYGWPLAWTRSYGNGRIFYEALGHGVAVWRRSLVPADVAQRGTMDTATVNVEAAPVADETHAPQQSALTRSPRRRGRAASAARRDPAPRSTGPRAPGLI